MVEMHFKSLTVLVLLLNITRSSGASYMIVADVEKQLGDLKHFWRSSGFW